jgi:CheY-like chemotaxis protein
MANILVADDDATYLTLLAKTLTNENHNVFIAKDGAEALKLCASQKFDLIITDILMPNVDGIDFIMELNKCNSPPAILVISGGRSWYAAEFNLQATKALGVHSVLKKPFTTERFLDAVRRALVAH